MTTITHVVTLLFAVAFCTVLGIWTGAQIGVIESHRIGALQACQNIRLAVIDCEVALAASPLGGDKP